MSSGIKEVIKSYISIDDEMKVLRKQASALKAQKDSLGEQISDYLKENSKDSSNAILEIGKDSFKLVTTKKKKLNRTILEDTIKQKTNDETAQLIMTEIMEESEENYLKRSTKK